MKKMTRMEGAVLGCYCSLMASSVVIFVTGMLALALIPYSPEPDYLLVRLCSGLWAAAIIIGTIFGFCKPEVFDRIIP